MNCSIQYCSIHCSILFLNVFLKKIPVDVFRKEKAENKWMDIFAENDFFPLLYKLISIIFSIPVGNAFVEREFSLVSAQWTKEKNSLCEWAVKSILQVKVNLVMSYHEVHQVVSKNKELLQQIVSSVKYLIGQGSHSYEYISFINFCPFFLFSYLSRLSLFLGSNRW